MKKPKARFKGDSIKKRPGPGGGNPNGGIGGVRAWTHIKKGGLGRRGPLNIKIFLKEILKEFFCGR